MTKNQRLSGMKEFINWQITQVRKGGFPVLMNKIKRIFIEIIWFPLYLLAIIPVTVIRLIHPWVLIRIGALIGTRIGHFAANTELYLCERDAYINVPNQRHIDIFFIGYRPVCNHQLFTMWRRSLRIWSCWWILWPILRINRIIPGGSFHEVGLNSQHDRDVHNLLDRSPQHLQFTAEESFRGKAALKRMGIPENSEYVCLTVRDSAYLESQHKNSDYSYHNYRDSDINNYVLAAESLADQGYFIIRMGAKVHRAMKCSHPKVIDYATNGMRTDFMDIYLGATCAFCISVGTGFDAIPLIFRRPIVYVNMVPVGYFFTFCQRFIGIFKHHLDSESNRELSLSEIVHRGVFYSMYSSVYQSNGVQLMENTPEEIRDVCVEMAEGLRGNSFTNEEDEVLQQRFWEIFPTDALDEYSGNPLHGEIRARCGTSFLRNNPEWLQ